MPQADNKGVSIHYEVEGEGPPLVLHHGSFGSLRDWGDFGYVAGLKDRRRLILMDARGHGQSAKPHDRADYSLAARVGDVVAVLDDLAVQKADFLGFSMGGWIGFGLALHAPERFSSLILGGAHPFAENMQPFRSLLPESPAELPARLEPFFGDCLLPAMRERMAANDIQALRALTFDRADFSQVLPKMPMPCLLFVGDADPRLPQVEDCARRMPDASLLALKGCGHVQAFGRSAQVLPHVQGFLDRL